MASDYFHRIFLRYDLIKPWLNIWKLLYKLVLNTLYNWSFQLDAAGHIFLFVKFLEHDTRWSQGQQRKVELAKVQYIWARGRSTPTDATLLVNWKTQKSEASCTLRLGENRLPLSWTHVGGCSASSSDFRFLSRGERVGCGQEKTVRAHRKDYWLE